MIKSLQILLILLFVLGGNICYSQETFSFEKEDITFELKDKRFIIQGLYYFNSETEKMYSILYPFPTESIYSSPSKINVKYLDSGESIIYKKKRDSSSIVFKALIKKENPIMISYQQQLKSNKAKYILKSTNYWNKPLERVNYKLITELDFVINNFSIPPDKEIILENKKIYLWQRENFMPTKDFEIEF